MPDRVYTQSGPRRPARRLALERLAPVALLALVALFWVDKTYLEDAADKVIGGVDLIVHFYPTMEFLHNELQTGRLPLWNPYQMAGQPFLALHVTAALYPPNVLLAWLLSADRAAEALAVLHLSLAAVFTWLFAGRLGLSPAARLAAALGFALSGEMVFGVYMAPCLATHAWLPPILWAVDGLVRDGRRRWAVALGIVLGVCLLAGYAQGLFYALPLAMAYGVVGLAWLTPRGRRLRTVLLAVIAAVIAVGVTAPQVLPTLELVQQSVRPLEGLTLEQASRPVGPPRVLFAALFQPWGLELVDDATFARWRRMTLPMSTVPLVVLGAFLGRTRRAWLFFATAALLSALFVVGTSGPLFAWVYELPLGRTFRGPLRMLFVFHFAVAMLLGIGVESGQAALARLSGSRRVALVGGAVLALLVAGECWGRARLPAAHPAVAPVPGAPPELVAFLRSRPGRERVFVQGWALGDERLMDKLGMMHGLFALPDYESNMPEAYQRFLLERASRTWQGDLTLAPDLGAPRKSLPRQRALDLMSVRYYVSVPGRARVDEALDRVARRRITRGDWQLFERPSALPRAYVVGRVQAAAGTDEAIALAMSRSFDPRREAVVVGEGVPSALLEAPAADPEAVGRADVVSYASHEVVLEAACAQSCLLVLTDLSYPGWQLAVDGRPQPIVTVNGIFRGAVLEPGRHRVVYRYEPAALRAGVWGAAAALLLAGLGLRWVGAARGALDEALPATAPQRTGEEARRASRTSKVYRRPTA